jgi:excisionase family DNA binding protein
MDPRKKYLSTGAAARKLAVSRATFQRWCREGHIPAQITRGGHYRVTVEAIDAFIASLLASRLQAA